MVDASTVSLISIYFVFCKRSVAVVFACLFYWFACFVRKFLGPIIVAIKKVASAYSGHCTKTLRRARDHFLLVLTLARFFTAEVFVCLS